MCARARTSLRGCGHQGAQGGRGDAGKLNSPGTRSSPGNYRIRADLSRGGRPRRRREQSRTGARSSLSTASSLGSITPGGRCVQRWVAGNLAPIASVSHSAPGCPPTNQSPARGDQGQDPVTLRPGFREPPRTCCEPSPRRPQVKTVPASTRTHAARPPAEQPPGAGATGVALLRLPTRHPWCCSSSPVRAWLGPWRP